MRDYSVLGDPGGVPFFFWVATCAVIGAVVGLQTWWREPTTARQRAIVALIAELEEPTTRTGAYLRLEARPAEAAGPLLAAAQRPDYGARAEAIELLGRLEVREALPFLLALSEYELADERLVALGRIGGVEAKAEIVAALAQDERVELKFAALKALIRWPRGDLAPAAVQQVAALLTHEVWGLRELAARFMGEHRQAAAAEQLIRMLGDPEAPVRQAAAWALMQLSDPAGREAVERALERGAVVFEE